MSFTQLGLPEPIIQGVRAAGYSQPTPIQRRAIPIILSGRDLVGASETGSGKTAAFLLPILSRLQHGTPGLRCLILVPTRELAAQVEASAHEYSRFTDLRPGVVFGGIPIGPQERMLRHEGVDLLIATPGRLLDLHGRQSVSFDDVEIVVLDEADRMVDMGFAPDLRRILRLLRTDRQTLMFSATMPAELNRVAGEALRQPMRIDLGERKPAPAIAQAFYPVARHRKVDLLNRILSKESTRKAIVFVRSKRGADRLVRRLQELGLPATALHGDRSQVQRERALRDFRRGRAPFLVATDIASRGIDVDDVTHVINYDVPSAPEDYVHRIGRTGRMHASGKAITLMSPEEREQVSDIERFLGKKIDRVQVTDFEDGGADAESVSESDRTAKRPARAPRPPRRAPAEESASRPAHRPAGARRDAATAVAVATTPSPDLATDTHGRRRKLNSTDRRNRKRW